jgi:hypothetical protein
MRIYSSVALAITYLSPPSILYSIISVLLDSSVPIQKPAMHFITPFVTAALIASNAVAHPGHDMRTEIAERAAFMQTSKRDLSHCAAKMKIRGIENGNVARRTALAKNPRKKRSIAASK